jgi:hypothetical protein
MNFQCPKCLWILTLGPGDTRLPPWCSKCGVDLKQDDWQVAQSAPPAPSPRPVSTVFVGEDEITQVTGTGGKPWLNPAKPAPASEPMPSAEMTSPLQDKPTTASDVDENLGWIVLGMEVVGGILLVIALLLAVEVWMFAKNAQTANGRVVTELRADPLAFAMYYRDLVIQYEVNGVKHELPAGRLEEGQQVEIVYPPADPQKGRLKGSLYMWPRLVGAAGLLLLLSGLAVGLGLAFERRTKAAKAAKDTGA